MPQDTDPTVNLKLTKRVRVYLRMCARELIDEHENNDVSTLRNRRDDIWHDMTPAERAATNELVRQIFGKWY